MLSWLQNPWPWYFAGPLIGLMVPLLLLTSNKSLGVSSSLRHICAACFPAKLPFFHYDWKKEVWNLFFVAGILLGGYLAITFLPATHPIQVNEHLVTELQGYGMSRPETLIPNDLFSWSSLLTLKGFAMMVLGGFLVGFGTRYAGGCTSGHSIMGLSTLQWPSLVATCCFLAGGFIMANLVMPLLLR